jgi:hypothetical protein
MEQDSVKPSEQSTHREVNDTMQWVPHYQQYSLSFPSLFPPQAYQNSQGQPLAYYQPYHYATSNHPKSSPAPQITNPQAVLQITYPTENNTNPQVKTTIHQ